MDFINLKSGVHETITSFFATTLENCRIQEYKSLNNIDYLNMAKGEKIILHHFTFRFLGQKVLLLM